MLTVLTQKPPFITGNLRLLTLAATLEAALQVVFEPLRIPSRGGKNSPAGAGPVQNAHQVHDGVLDTYLISCY
jgi:hypothetical protein